jgi:hypothetical protein
MGGEEGDEEEGRRLFTVYVFMLLDFGICNIYIVQ